MERLNSNATTGDSDEGKSTWDDETKDARNDNNRNGTRGKRRQLAARLL